MSDQNSGTIQMKVTWEGSARMLLLIIETSNVPEDIAWAREEIGRMARLADLYAAQQEGEDS
jgi:hypothetical protein